MAKLQSVIKKLNNKKTLKREDVGDKIGEIANRLNFVEHAIVQTLTIVTDFINTESQVTPVTEDPHHTKVGPKQVVPLKRNDSTADILAKMYNFMVKTREEEKKRYELWKDFEQERIYEEERRHKDLLKRIRKTGDVGVISNKDKGGLWGLLSNSIGKLISGIQSLMGFLKDGLMSTISLGFNAIKSFVGGIKDFLFGGEGIKSFFNRLAGLIAGGMGIKQILNSDIINNIKKTSIETFRDMMVGFTTNIIPKLWKSIGQTIVSVWNSIGSYAGSMGGPIAKTALFMFGPKPIKMVAAAFGISDVVSGVANFSQNLRYGDEYTSNIKEAIQTFPNKTERRKYMENLDRYLDSPEKLKEQGVLESKEEYDVNKHKRIVSIVNAKKARKKYIEDLLSYDTEYGLHLDEDSWMKKDEIVIVDKNGKTYSDKENRSELIDKLGPLLIIKKLKTFNDQQISSSVKSISEEVGKYVQDINRTIESNIENVTGTDTIQELRRQITELQESSSKTFDELSNTVERTFNNTDITERKQHIFGEQVSPGIPYEYVPDNTSSTVTPITNNTSSTAIKYENNSDNVTNYNSFDTDVSNNNNYFKDVIDSLITVGKQLMVSNSMDYNKSYDSAVHNFNAIRNLDTQTIIPELMEETDVQNGIDSQKTQVINSVKNNNFGGKSKFTDITSVDVRNDDKSMRMSSIRSFVPV